MSGAARKGGNPDDTERRPVHPVLRVGGASLLALVVLFIVAFAVLQTGFAKSRLATFIELTVNELSPVKIGLRGLDGLLPFTLSLERLELGDEMGEWLVADGVTARIGLLSLVSGEIAIAKLRADALTVKRAPAVAESPDEEPQDAHGFPARISVSRFEVGRVELWLSLLGVGDADGTYLEFADASGAVAWNLRDSTARAELAVRSKGIADAAAERLALAMGPFGLGASLDGPLASPVITVELHAAAIASRGVLVKTALLNAALERAAAGEQPWQVELHANGIDGKISGGLHLQATGTTQLAKGLINGSLAANADLSAEDTTLAAVLTGPLVLQSSFTVSPEQVAFTEIDLVSEALAISGTAALATPKEAARTVSAGLSVTVPQLSVFRALLGPRAAGSGSLSLQASGPVDNFSVDASMIGVETVFGDAPAMGLTAALQVSGLPTRGDGTLNAGFDTDQGKAELRARFIQPSDETIRLTSVVVRAPGSLLEGEFEIGLTDRLVGGTAKLRSTSLTGLGRLAGVDAAGRLDGDVRLVGESGKQRVVINVVGNDMRITVSDIVIAAAGTDLHLDATDLAGAPSVDARGTIDGLRYQEAVFKRLTFDARGAEGKIALRTTTAGTYYYSFDADAAASLELGEGENRILVKSLSGRFANQNVRLQRPATVVLAADGFSVDGLALDLAGGSLRVDMATRGGKLAGDGVLRSVPVSLLRLIEPTLELEGALDGRVHATGTTENPEIDLDLTASGLRSTALPPDQAPRFGLRANAHLDGVGAVLDVVLQDDGSTSFTGSVRSEKPAMALRGDPDTPIHASLRGTADMRVLRDLVQLREDRLEGALRADLSADGTPSALRLYGNASLDGALYENAAAGLVLRDLKAQLDGKGQGLELTSLSASDGNGGTLRGSGRVDFSRGYAAASHQSALVLRGFRVLRRDDLEAVASGDLTLSGDADGSILRGQLKLEQADISIPENLPPGIVSLDVVEKNIAAARRVSEKGGRAEGISLRLAVEVSAPGQVFVRGKDIDTEWKARLAVKGTASRPLVSGKLEIIRGHVSVVGLRFTPERGSVTLDGRDKIDPILDIAATAKRNSVLARVVIEGRVSAPEFMLTSEPAMPRDEIVSQLLFGKSAGGLTAVQALQLADAVATLAGKRSRGPGLLNSVRRRLGADVVELTGDQETGGTALSVGKYVTGGVFVSVNQGLTHEGSSATVEVELTPSVRLETEVGAEERSKVGINWRWEY